MSVSVDEYACELREVVDSTICQEDAPLDMNTRGESGVVRLDCDAPGSKRRDRPDEPVCWAPRVLENTLFEVSEHAVENGKDVFAYPADAATDNFLVALKQFRPFDFEPKETRPQHRKRIVVTPTGADGSTSSETVAEMLARLRHRYDSGGEAALEEQARRITGVVLDRETWRANERVYDAYFRVMDAQDAETDSGSVRPFETARLALEARFDGGGIETNAGEPIRGSEADNFLSLGVNVPTAETVNQWATNNLLLSRAAWFQTERALFARHSQEMADAVDAWFAGHPDADRLSAAFVEDLIARGEMRTPAHLRELLMRRMPSYVRERVKTNETVRMSVEWWLDLGWTVAAGEPTHISNWDVSQVTDMSELFMEAEDFDDDLSNWDVSNVVDMSFMFQDAKAFKGAGVSGWDVSNVRTMYGMFSSAETFDQDLTSWNVLRVVNTSGMFYNASSFRGVGLSEWNVSNVTDMGNMFAFAITLDGDLSKWDVSNVVDMMGMCNDAKTFRGAGLSAWDVSNVTDLAHMFDGAETFDADLSMWNVSKVTNMSFMFIGAKAFKGAGLSGWDVSNVVNMSHMFHDAAAFDQNLSGWNVSNVRAVNDMFFGAETFDGDLSSWDVSKVTNMSFMFAGAKAFRGAGLSGWNVSNVTYMTHMFSGARTFDADLSRWNVSKVFNMSHMFEHTEAFRGVGLSEWNVRDDVNTFNMFANATALSDGGKQTLSWVE